MIPLSRRTHCLVPSIGTVEMERKFTHSLPQRYKRERSGYQATRVWPEARMGPRGRVAEGLIQRVEEGFQSK